VDWLVKNITYRSVRFVFSTWDCIYWQLLKTLRQKDNFLIHGRVVCLFGCFSSLMQNLTLSNDDPNTTYPSQDAVWERFEMEFVAIAELVSYAPVFKDFLYKGLEQLFHDNITYLELRTGLSRVRTVGTHQFVAEHPGFLGAQLIISVPRYSTDILFIIISDTICMQKDFPEFVAGFDLVRILLRGRTNHYFGVTLPYFFHAGETDHEDTEVDESILDALLFNTTRIGNGVAVPESLCVNDQVLKLVSDLRNHPAAVSDDPSLFGNTGLSYDFYEVFVVIGGLRANLGTLKELAIISIRYSSLPSQLKERGLAMWRRLWDKFISENSYSNP
uniref:Uncharacterized protein n=1 Tax=Oncorhynchus tshawytscha TaxID=74940 RepID=A0A8C8C641_ONCTS